LMIWANCLFCKYLLMEKNEAANQKKKISSI